MDTEDMMADMTDDMMEDMMKKLSSVESCLKSAGSVAIAYSGGTDSTLLAKLAKDTLKDKAIAITVKTPLMPEEESRDAKATAESIGIRHVIIESDIPEQIACNPENRCYLCKRHIMLKIIETAKENNIETVIDGTNADDMNEYRPGMRAIEELKIKSPLKDANLTKDEIRRISKSLGLQTYDRPSNTCLATRIPHGETITSDRLMRIGSSEAYLKTLGIRVIRVREKNNGNDAKIETAKESMPIILKNSGEILEKLKEFGYETVTLDLKPYKSR